MSRKVVDKLNTFLGKDWANLLRDQFDEDYMSYLGKIIAIDRVDHTVYPSTPAKVFSVFRRLRPKDIKVVIVGQDPYHDGSYDGRAFSNSDDRLNFSPSLRNILKEVEDDIYGGLQLGVSGNLARWENQGVFLMNRVLTVRKGEPNSHANIGWEKFTSKVIERLSSKYINIVFMLWGVKANTLKKLIDEDKHLVLSSGHPSPLSANQGLWFGNKHFSKANAYLKKHHNHEIIW